MNDIGGMVGGEQRDMVNQIDDNLHEVKHNVATANEEMDEAIVYQKKSKKKYICIIVTIVVVLLIAFGIIYFLVIK
jgi:t-SNARE complex subunit (syntaxin)